MSNKIKVRKFKAFVGCCILDQNGKRCKNKYATTRKIHFDPELYGFIHNKPGWGSLPVCEKHAKEIGK